MKLNADGIEPIYVQIANWLETEILSGKIKDDEKVYSQYQLADMFNINPATAAKGLTLLVDENIVYKRRGLGMFVTAHAKEDIRRKRIQQTLKRLVLDVAIEAKRLDVSEEELINMIKTVKSISEEA